MLIVNSTKIMDLERICWMIQLKIKDKKTKI